MSEQFKWAGTLGNNTKIVKKLVDAKLIGIDSLVTGMLTPLEIDGDVDVLEVER